MAESIQKYDRDSLAAMYLDMRRIREFERALDELVDVGEIPGNAHLATGQEAVAVGLGWPLRNDDLIAGTHRSHHHVIAKGAPLERVLAECGGRVEGINGGRGGEMHLFDSDAGVLETSGMVGTNPPHVTGAALAADLDGTDSVGVSVFGDGAVNQGVLFETMNLASIWNLPVLFVCENNGYAVTTESEYAVAGTEIPARAEAFDIPGQTVDGQDVIAVAEAATEAVEALRRGDGPQFVECRTYRYHGHFSEEENLLGDRPYRSQAEIDEWRENHDPLETFSTRLLEGGDFSPDDLEELDDRASEEVADAVEFLETAAAPVPERAPEHTYADQDYPNLPQPNYR